VVQLSNEGEGERDAGGETRSSQIAINAKSHTRGGRFVKFKTLQERKTIWIGKSRSESEIEDSKASESGRGKVGGANRPGKKREPQSTMDLKSTSLGEVPPRKETWGYGGNRKRPKGN